ncbi:MAG: hypothetical protein L0332_15735 [Chloroflexi bacterium]|nr:hypothetical protein [Chloroflexota bacterium]MCI0575627.1 hypothetical protein [Chloroflexota bacterium]MCI0648621.1 hypothetical protein [Chloroflexota bacterium]MCI0728152.1 hypothetical protein [Chloroflexota bacterium]
MKRDGIPLVLDWAQQLCEESIRLARQHGDRLRLADALWGLGTTAHYKRELTLARATLKESAALCVKSGILYVTGVMASVVALASVAAVQGDFGRTARLCSAADTLLRAQGLALMKPDARAFEQTTFAPRFV